MNAAMNVVVKLCSFAVSSQKGGYRLFFVVPLTCPYMYLLHRPNLWQLINSNLPSVLKRRRQSEKWLEPYPLYNLWT